MSSPPHPPSSLPSLYESVVAPVTGDDDTSVEYHTSQVLLYSSLAVGAATLLAIPGFGFHFLRSKAGTRPVMLIGAACFCIVALMSLLLDEVMLRKFLWLIYIIYGAGRSVWENTVKVNLNPFLFISLFLYKFEYLTLYF